MRLILIRHPETVANAQNLIYGHHDWEYSEEGERTCLIAAKYVKEKYEEVLKQSGTKIIATPLSRTQILAEKIAEGTGIPVEIEDDLIELNVGIFENMSVDEAEKTYEKEWSEFISDEVNYVVPQGESWMDVHNRTGKFLAEAKSQEGTVIAVTHAMVIRSLLAHCLNIPLKKSWHFHIEPTCLVEIKFVDNFGMITEIVQLS